MKRLLAVVVLGVIITLLPYLLRPLFGEQAAIFWLPGFAAVSHWFPLGLRGPNGGTAKLVACLVNVPIWATAFLIFSGLMHWSSKISKPTVRREMRGKELSRD
ncbi:MAG TPA: hypothetical protein VF493_10120 [Terriglobales bacterium]